jgi:hypothetical protein
MKKNEIIEAEQFFSFTQNGYSRPARLGCSRADGSNVDVYVKFIGGVEAREFGLVAELVCSLLAREIGLNVPRPFIVNLSPEFLAGVPKVAQDLVKRSLGLNFASESAPVGYSLVPPEPRVPLALRSSAAEVFAFDIIVQNCDRKADNPNLLWDRSKIMLIDHERALGFVRENPAPSFSSLELDRYYDHVFYSAVSPGDAEFGRLTDAFGHLTDARIETLLGKIPEPWQVKEDLAKVRDYLSWVVANRLQVCNLIRERLT